MDALLFLEMSYSAPGNLTMAICEMHHPGGPFNSLVINSNPSYPSAFTSILPIGFAPHNTAVSTRLITDLLTIQYENVKQSWGLPLEVIWDSVAVC